MLEINVKFLSSAMHVQLLMSKSILHVDKFEKKINNNNLLFVVYDNRIRLSSPCLINSGENKASNFSLV